MLAIAQGLIILAQLIQFYRVVLVVRIILTWVFPQHKWFDPPLSYLAAATDPVMRPFSRIIPPIGMIDISPIILFILLDFIASGIRMLAISLVSGS